MECAMGGEYAGAMFDYSAYNIKLDSILSFTIRAYLPDPQANAAFRLYGKGTWIFVDDFTVSNGKVIKGWNDFTFEVALSRMKSYMSIDETHLGIFTVCVKLPVAANASSKTYIDKIQIETLSSLEYSDEVLPLAPADHPATTPNFVGSSVSVKYNSALAATQGVPQGYSNDVVKMGHGGDGAGATFDFTDEYILIDSLRSFSVRAYMDPADASAVLRLYIGRQMLYYGGDSGATANADVQTDADGWSTYTFTIGQTDRGENTIMTAEFLKSASRFNGDYLTAFTVAMRHGSGTYYTDSITFDSDTYNVTFSTNGETTTKQVSRNAKTARPQDPQSDDKYFAGWSKSENGSTGYWDFSKDIFTEDTTLYAIFTDEAVTVTFNSSGGSAVAPQTFGKGGVAEKPLDPVRADHTFLYWMDQNDRQYDFLQKVNANITLTAKWVKMYSVTVMDGSNSIYTTTVLDGEQFTDPVNSVRDAYSTLWTNYYRSGYAMYFSEELDGERYDFSAPVTKNTTLYVCYKQIVNYAKSDEVSLKDVTTTRLTDPMTAGSLAGGLCALSPDNTTKSMVFKAKMRLDKLPDGTGGATNILNVYLRGATSTGAVSYNGCKLWMFPGEWYIVGSSQTVGSVNIYHASFNSVEDFRPYLSSGKLKPYSDGKAEYIIEYGVIEAAEPGFEDYDRLYLKINDVMLMDICISTLLKDGNPGIEIESTCKDPDSNTMLYGVYPMFDIQFKNGEQDVIPPIQVKKYAMLSQPQTPEGGDGMAFAGWYNDNKKWDFAKDKVVSHMALVARWGYTLSFDIDGNTKTDVFAKDLPIDFDTLDTNKNGFGKEGYDFDGWYTEIGDKWLSTNTVSEPTRLIARYTKLHNVRFEVNGYFYTERTVRADSPVIGRFEFDTPTPDDDSDSFLGWYVWDPESETCTERFDPETDSVTKDLILTALFGDPNAPDPGNDPGNDPGGPEDPGKGPSDAPSGGNNGNDNSGNGGLIGGIVGGVGGAILIAVIVLVMLKKKGKIFNKNTDGRD